MTALCCVVGSAEYLAVPVFGTTSLNPGNDVVGLVPAPAHSRLVGGHTVVEAGLAKTILCPVDPNAFRLVEHPL